jgi:hypothetical protein
MVGGLFFCGVSEGGGQRFDLQEKPIVANVTDTFYASEADIGYGSELLVGQDDGSPETFVAVYGVREIKPGKLTAGVLSKAHLRSIGRAEEKISTIRDYENFTVRAIWRPEHGSQSNAGGDGFTSGGMLALHRSQEIRNFMVLVGDDSPRMEWPFTGIVTGFDPPALNNEGIPEVTFEITPVSDYTADLP